MRLIALKDISDQIRVGDAFEAPDTILVAIGFARLDDADESPSGERDESSGASRSVRRRPRREIEAY